MCLIIYKKEGISNINSSILNEAFISNNDGFGLMYSTGDGSIIVKKTLEDIKVIEKLVEEHSFGDKQVAYHFRFATHGLKDINNVHPFKILDKEMDGVDMYLMHNGVLNTTSWNNNMSDTWHFVQGWLMPLIKRDKFIISKPWFKKYVEYCIGPGNKLLIMDGFNNVEIFNQLTGKWTFENLWLSNEHYTYSHDLIYRNNPPHRIGRRISRINYEHWWDDPNDEYNKYYLSDNNNSYDNNNDNTFQSKIVSSIKTDHELKINNDNDNKIVDAVVKYLSKPKTKIENYDYSSWIKLTDSDLFEMDLDDLLKCMEANPEIIAEWIFITLYGKS